MFKPIIKNLLRSAGYEIRRISAGPHASSPFCVQRNLVASANPAIIFDVGAYHGQTVKRYASGFPEAAIYCFEPFHESFKVLEQVALCRKGVKPYCLAIADSRGKRTFYLNQMSATNSLLPRPGNLRRYYPLSGETVGQVQVETTTLDFFCRQSALSRIDILKMDIQGGELLALKGAAGLLSESRIGLIYTEVMFVPHYEGGALFHELCEFLARFGYSLYDLFLLTQHAANGQLRQGDAIFVSPRMRTEVVDSFAQEP